MKTVSIVIASVGALAIVASEQQEGQKPAIDSQVTFLYYKDVDAAARFYGETLGLEKTFDE